MAIKMITLIATAVGIEKLTEKDIQIIALMCFGER